MVLWKVGQLEIKYILAEVRSLYTTPSTQEVGLLKRCTVLFFRIKLSILFDESLLQRYKFKISVETVKSFGRTKQFCIMQLPISYCAILIVVAITRHVFINFFQTEHISAVKFNMGYEKNMSFLVIPKSPKVWQKKLKKLDWASLLK